VCLVVSEHILQISLKLSDALHSPPLDLVAAATEADDVVNMLRHIRGDENLWRDDYTTL
jgi:hypothetical protein